MTVGGGYGFLENPMHFNKRYAHGNALVFFHAPEPIVKGNESETSQAF
jgi:hypothetical protein